MASDDSSDSRPAPAQPIVLRIKLRYDDLEVMVARFATNVGKSGLFLPTKSLQPLGSEVKFELRLADDTPALVGFGRVKAVTPPDPLKSKATFGMAIELMRVTPQSRALILRMLDKRRELGLPELGLPMAADIDATRRVDQPTPAGLPVVAAPPVAPSLPAAPPPAGIALPPMGASSSAGISLPPVGSTSSPGIPLPPLASADAPPSDGLMTSPRRTTGQLAVAKVTAVAPLAPEPPRRRRAAVSEVVERASGPVAVAGPAVPGLDDNVDVSAVLARARALTGGSLDAELEALADASAAPRPISIEAASAELAKQLGGSAVRRDRSARWSTPPETTAAPAAPDEPPATASTDELAAVDKPVSNAQSALADEPAPTDELAAVDKPVSNARSTVGEPEAVASSDAAPAITADADESIESAPAAVEPEPTAAIEPPDAHAAIAALADAEPPEVEPSQIADEIHQLHDFDLEDVEHTELGDIPQANDSYPDNLPGSSAIERAALAARLEAQLAEAEAEADADDLGLPSALGITVDGDPEEPRARSFDDEDDETGEPHDLSLEEIEDFEILAEADAADEDLLDASAEHEASARRAPSPRPAARLPSEIDFAARLDFGEESDVYYTGPSEFATHHVEEVDPVIRAPADLSPRRSIGHSGMRDPLLDSAGQALAAFDLTDEPLGDTGERPRPGSLVEPIFEPESTNSFTLAGPPNTNDLDLPHATTQQLPVFREPGMLREPPRVTPSLYDSPVEDHELEHALEALDVDLDDLSIPHEPGHSLGTPKPRPLRSSVPTALQPTVRPQPAQTRSMRRTSPPPPAGRVVASLAGDDDMVIEFEEED